MTRARPTVAAVIVSTLMLWLSIAIAATVLWPVYGTVQFVILVVVGVAVGTVIALLGARFRWPALIVMAATVVAFLLIGVPLAVPSQAQSGVLPTLGGLADLVAGVALGWKQLLTITLPVGDYEALLVPALVLVLVSTVAGLSIALRARNPEFAVIVPAVFFLVATAFGPQFPERPVAASLGLLAIVLFWLVWFRWSRRRAAIALLASQSGTTTTEARGGGARTVLAAALIIALASGAGIAASSVLPPAEDRTVLRTTVEQPFDPRDYISPLSSFRRYWQLDVRNDLLFTVSGLPEGARVRLATMDTYNGVVYSVGSDRVTTESGSFTRVPFQFDQSDTAGTPARIIVEVGEYTGVWMPSIGQLERVQFSGARSADLSDGFFYNDTTGTSAVIAELTSGDGYTLDAVVSRALTESNLEGLTPGSATVPDAAAVPEELTAALDEYVRGTDTPGARLQAALDGLRADGYISHGVEESEPASRSGHASDRIAELFTSPRMIGDAEQYAVAAALMAGELGFPARVVMGFVPASNEVRGEDVSAWIEVHTAELGWLALDPVPPLREIPEELPEDNAQVTRPPTIVPPPVIESEDIDRQTTPDSEQELEPSLDPVLQIVLLVLRIAAWVALVALIVMAPFILILAAKVRRRRLRRRAPDAASRILGGWNEFEDAVLDRGWEPGPAATRSEVAAIAGGVQSQVLAAVTDRATFSPDIPEDTEADAVWRAVEDLEAQLDEGRTRWERFKSSVSLRSLGGYSVTTLFRRSERVPRALQ